MLGEEIERFCDALLIERGRADNTCEAYSRDLRRFAAFLRKREVVRAADIALADIQDFIGSEREEGMGAATRARRTAAIRTFLSYLRECRLIRSNPAELLESAKKGLVLPRVLSEDEVAKMLDAVSGETPRDLRDRAILEVAYGCGLRVSELCAVKIEDFIGEELLRVLGKGSKERVVPIGGSAGRALRAYMERARPTFAVGRASERHLFLTRLGRQFTRQGLFKIVRERAAAAGIQADRISPHVLRHCFASHMLQHGADLRVIQELLGHADVGTTQIYTHVDHARFADIHRQCHPRA